MFTKTPAKPLLMTTTMTLTRPYRELGLVYSYAAKLKYEDAMEALRKETLRKYPDADAVIGIALHQTIVGFGLIGTAVTTERTDNWTPSSSET